MPENEKSDVKKKGDYKVYVAPVPEGVDPRSIGVDFNKLNGYCWKNQKGTIYGMFRIGDHRYKVMLVENKPYTPKEEASTNELGF